MKPNNLKIWNTLTWLLVIAQWAYLLLFIFMLPNTIPTHFSITGTPDSYGSKHTLFILPSITFGIAVLFAYLYTKPQIYNYPVAVSAANQDQLYKLGQQLLFRVNLWIQSFCLILLVYVVHIAQIGQGSLPALAIALFIFGLLAIIGNCLRKMMKLA